ncbi:CBS domain-containing protein [Mycoplasmatota bacterium WC30]
MEKEREFMKIFNRLEKYLRIEYNQGNYTYSGFMSTMHRIRKSKKNPSITNKYNFDIIQQASQIRNIISHNNNVLIPTDKFLDEFRGVVDKICHPIKVENIMVQFSKLKVANLEDSVGTVISILKEKGYNTIPIIENNELLGIFTEKSIYDYLSIHKNNMINKDMKIKDIISAIDLNSDPRKYFEFINRNATIEEAYDLFDVDLKHRRELLLLLVTETGAMDEGLLGIVALRDIENVLLN